MVALLPEAEQLLTLTRQIRSSLVRQLPAHVSLLYPGPPPQELTKDLDQTRQLLPVETELTSLITSKDGFIGIAVPDLDPAAERLRGTFPAAVPYGGQYGAAPAAHLTLALDAHAHEIQQVHNSVAQVLPCRSQVLGPYAVEQGADGWRPIEAPQ